jgi:LuxR family transcriptional regulator, maltose regulon positive regulatory protein
MDSEAGKVPKFSRTHIVKRPRLTSLLDGASARILLLVAPAGYGKTTLAREWLEQKPHVWYRGNAGSADVAALALGLARATAVLVPGVEERLRPRLRVSSAPCDEAESLAELLAEDLTDWPSTAWLVFDDYHFACDSAPAERFVERFASCASVRLLIASRSRPSWATARRLLYGEILEVGRNSLALTQDEANAILSDRGTNTDDALVSLADGWPALVGLAALATKDPLPGEGRPDELYSYFAEELYQALPDDIQRSLRRLSLAPVITPDIAATLLNDKAELVVETAARLGFFLSTARERPELHPLLRSFLASKFDSHQDDPGKHFVSGLVRTLLEREDWDDAFELIERFFDGALLVELLEAALLRMIDESRLPTLQRWIRTASGHQFDSALVDLAEAEVALKQGDLRNAEAFAVQAVRQMPSHHALTSKALWLAGMSAHLTSREQTALGYFEEAGRLARSGVDQRQALWGRFTAMNKLDKVSGAAQLLDELEKCSTKCADDLLRVGTGRLMLASLTGQVLQALESVDLVAPLTSRARDPWVLSSFLNVHAALLTLGGRYSDALVSAQSEMDVARAYGLSFVIRHAQFHLAASFWGLRDFRSCASALRASEKECMASGDDFVRMNVGVLNARIHMATGAIQSALDVLESYQHPASTKPMQAEYFAWWSLAHSLSNDSRGASMLASRAERMSPRIEVRGLLPWTRAVLAVRGRGACKPAATRAFTSALKSGNIDAFVTAYRACPELLEVLSADAERRECLRSFLERSRDHKLAQSIGLRLPKLPETPGSAGLSRREHEVIDLVAQGLTNKEIGRALYITEATVKVHLRKICRKLGVRGRTEAALRAAELSG